MSEILAGIQEIYKQMMLIDLFETHQGGWASNLPEHIKVLAGVMWLVLLAIMIFGLCLTYLIAVLSSQTFSCVPTQKQKSVYCCLK